MLIFNIVLIIKHSIIKLNNCREKGEKGEKKRKRKEPKDKKNKKKGTEDEDGLTAKQRRKIVSKAMISSSEGSESEDEKLKIDVGG